MAIVQEAFDIPIDIYEKILSGEYKRFGSIVRRADGPNKGQIVKHLQSVESKTAEEARGIGVKALQFVKQHKKGIIIIAACTAVIGGGVLIYSNIKKSEPKIVKTFRVALETYVEAIREGKMDVEKINALMIALEELKKYNNYEKISIQLTTKELEILVNRIYDYTIKLAEDNFVELTENELHIPRSTNRDAIIDLQTYLEAQKRIFESAS